jgi:hypothetical protein
MNHYFKKMVGRIRIEQSRYSISGYELYVGMATSGLRQYDIVLIV